MTNTQVTRLTEAESKLAELLGFAATMAATYLGGVPAESEEQSARAWLAAFKEGRIDYGRYVEYQIRRLEFVAGRLRRIAEARGALPLVSWNDDRPLFPDD